MHSCSDKRELVRSGAAQHMLQLYKRQLHAAFWPRGKTGEGRDGRKGGRLKKKRERESRGVSF